MSRRQPTSSGSRRRARSRGQVAVIFAGSIVLFVALCAVVCDVAYYWVSTLRAQRAADAAALAGAVYLPGDKATAYQEARDSATQNGYTNGGGVTVTPVQDLSEPRQLDVTITTSVPTFFARAVGINSWPLTRTAKGIYVLPVPMGSPLAYYGVGDFFVNKTTTNTTNYANASVPGYTSNPSSGAWGTPDNGWATGTTNFATASSNNLAQQWSSLKIPTISGSTLDGIVVSFKAKVATASTACKVQAEVSWNGGSSWNNASPALASGNLTTTSTGYAIGSQTALAAWGNNHTWAAGDFSNSNFRVRLTYLKGSGCGDLSLNTLVVTVYSHTTTSTTTITKTDVIDPDGNVLASQGAWGATITKGGNQENGDAYSPYYNRNYSPNTNAIHDANGYDYVVQLSAGGTVRLFDPSFCAMGSNGAAGYLGAGDHWIGGPTGTSAPVSTYYTLWNTNGKLGLPRTSWTQVYTSGSTFENQTGYDPANGGNPGGATSGCDAYHHSWWTIPTGALGGGTYVLQVQTSKTKPPNGGADSSINDGTNAENMWAIEVTGGGTPQVYGNGRMAVYNNLRPGLSEQRFYLAKIDQATGAGKTAVIDLFDPGDVAGNAFLEVLSPDGNTQTQVTFDYTTDGNCIGGNSDSCSGTGRSQIQTAKGGSRSFNSTWIHIRIRLPATYGSGGLWQGGWWQIRYRTPDGGNDTTTWQVSVEGNPVHLLVP